MKGKSAWMAGAAAIAMVTAGQASAQTTTMVAANDPPKHHHHHHHAATMSSTSTMSSSTTMSSGPTNAELEARISALEQQVESDEAKADAAHTRLSTLEQNFNDTTWTFDNGRPTIKSGDGRFSMSFRTRLQIDFADYMQPSVFNPGVPAAPAPGAQACNQRDLCSGVDVRRAYFGVEGKFYNDFWYELRLNFGGTKCESGFGAASVGQSCGDSPLNLARIAYQGIPNFRINVGIIQPVFTYGNSVSSAELTFMEFPSAVAAAISAGTTTVGTSAAANIQSAGFGGDDSRRGIELDYQKTDIFMPGDNLVVAASLTGQRTGSIRFDDEGTNTNGRIAYRFWSDGISNFQIGVNWGDILGIPGAHGHQFDISDRPESRVDGTQFVNTAVGANCGLTAAQAAALAAPANGGQAGTCSSATGASLWGAEAGFNWENFYGAGEYYQYTLNRDKKYFASVHSALGAADPANIVGIPDPTYQGYYFEGSWVITGEVKPYSPSNTANNYAVWGAPVPSRPFSLSGGSWGAWEVAARYSVLDLNFHPGTTAQSLAPGAAVPGPFGGVRGGEQSIISVALNWYLNRNVRMMFEYQNVDISKLTASAETVPGNRSNDNSQNFNTIMSRLQFAF